MGYKYYNERPEALTEEFVRKEYAKLAAATVAAEESEFPDQWIGLISDWNALGGYLRGEANRIGYRSAQDMTDPALDEIDRYFREQILPALTQGEHQFIESLLATRHQNAIIERYGDRFITVLRSQIEPLAPVNMELRIAEGRLIREYSLIGASATLDLDGRTMTLSQAGNLVESDDRDLRHKAFQGMRGWIAGQSEELGRIFSELVSLRDTMGRNLGFENFIHLGYLGLGRTDYGPEEVATFRENICRYAAPLARRLRKEQAGRLGLQRLRPWDSGYDPATTVPAGQVAIETQLDSTQRIFDMLSPRFAEYFRQMREENLIDLENRPGKRRGAFCTYMFDEERPAILCNSTGTANDIRTLIHEMGHAIQHWESRDIEPIILHSPTIEVCEIHSIGLEYLTLPFIGEFFAPEEATRFRRGRWSRSISAMCYRSVVDEFQHWVYETPTASPAERNEEWRRIGGRYESGIDYEGLEDYEGMRWNLLPHIFRSPFYYIDYAIAETAAMQLAMIASEDLDRALETYLGLCRIGGTKGLNEIFHEAGLRSPFDPTLMRDLMAHAAREVGIEEMSA